MKLISASIQRPVSVWVGIILLIIFGVLFLTNLPIQLLPTVDPPIITVTTPYPSAAPQEVEQQITIPMEEQLTSVQNLKRMESVSSEGFSTITMEFEWGINRDLASVDVLKKLNRVPDLPPEADEPIITIASTAEDLPIAWVVARGMDVDTLYELGEDVIKPRLERVEGVGQVDIYGGRERQVHVVVNPARLDSLSLTLNDLRQIIERENANVRGGTLDQRYRRSVVRTIGQYDTYEDLENVVVADRNGTPIYLRDVAGVQTGYEKLRAIVRVNGEPTVSFACRRRSGTNVLQVMEGVVDAVDDLNDQLGFTGTELSLAYREDTYIHDSIRRVIINLIVGALLAGSVLILFLRRFQTAGVIAFAIPTSVIGSFIFLAILGRTVNLITLAGLTFAAGMVVDNAIVVLENIYRHMEMGKERFQAALDGAKEVWGAILASTLTTVAVFLPVIFLKLEAGQLFRDIALSISFAVLLSLIVSITVIPMLAARVVKVHERGEDQQPGPGRIKGLFLKANQFLQASSWRQLGFTLIVIAVFFLSLTIAPPKTFLPQGNRNFMFGTAQVPPGTSLQQVSHMNSIAEEVLNEYPELDLQFSVSATNFNFVGCRIKDSEKDQVKRLVDEIRMKMFGIPGGQFYFTQASLFWRRGGGSANSVTLDIRGKDLKSLVDFSEQAEEMLQGNAMIQQTRSSFQVGSPEINIRIQREKVARAGLNLRDVAATMQAYLDGALAGQYVDQGKEVDLVLVVPDRDSINAADLRNAVLTNREGQTVHLKNIAQIGDVLGPTQISHIDRDRSITLTLFFDSEKYPLETVMNELERVVLHPLRQELPIGYTAILSGVADDLTQTYQALVWNFVLALLIIYLLMSALFESFTHPVIILFTVLLAMTGAILGVLLVGSQLDLVTMLGFIILAGIVVNNSILLVVQGLRYMRLEGIEPDEAILSAVDVRIRPIFMSTVTSILGMSPLVIFSGAGTELYKGLGAAIIGGLTLSTIFTLLLTPVLFSLYHKVASRISLPRAESKQSILDLED